MNRGTSQQKSPKSLHNPGAKPQSLPRSLTHSTSTVPGTRRDDPTLPLIYAELEDGDLTAFVLSLFSSITCVPPSQAKSDDAVDVNMESPRHLEIPFMDPKVAVFRILIVFHIC